jgi:CubicO group peptidase (beta-lactamase class C family)
MKKILERSLIGLGASVLLLVGGAAYFLLARVAPIGAGYQAKMLCSHLFVAKRGMQSVLSSDLEPFNPLLRFVEAEVDQRKRMVTSTAFGLIERQAVFHECLGCTVVPPSWEPEELRLSPACVDPEPKGPGSLPWPTGDLDAEGSFPSEVDEAKLRIAVDAQFSEPNPERPRRTRAMVVVYKGKIIAERYAEGFGREVPMHGWSMTKSITSALVGILAGRGAFAVDDPAPIPEWRDPGDPHGRITIAHLLRMSGGFDFHHDVSPAGQRQQALFGGIDSTRFSTECPLEVEPGSRWEYANANPHSLWRIIRDAVGEEEVLAFPRRALFNRIGMRSALIEPDPYGNPIGTSFGWATARDWARFGLLYLKGGVWEGERILPEGWVDYTVTPAPAAEYEHYGALFWLNAGADEFAKTAEERRSYPDKPPFSGIPADAYFAMGNDGQLVAVIPSRELVLVRLGLRRASEGRDYETLLADLLAAIGGSGP